MVSHLVLGTNRFNERSVFHIDCWSLFSVPIMFHVFVFDFSKFISVFHSADWRRNVEMQFSNCNDCKFCSPLGRFRLASAASIPPPCNLVDPASSHMLVSKIKPCMSQYKCFTAKLRMAH